MASQKIEIARARLGQVQQAIAAAAAGSFVEAEEALQDEGNDELSEVMASIRHFIGALRSNVEENERLFADLQTSKLELQETLDKVNRQQLAIQELSTPIIDIWDDIITLPIVGFIDSQRATNMTERLLKRIVSSKARCVIVDLSGVDAVDTMTANHLIKMIRAAQLLGSFCVVTGISADIAQTLIDLDVELERMRTMRTLKEGLKVCFAHLGRAEQSRWRPSSGAE